MLATRRRELETCTYCPKLCRAACPVSNVEPRETLIPWGKMSNAFFLARGDVPHDAEHAATAWACTGCMACRERCDHENDVAGTLGDARAASFGAGVAPAEARRVAASFTRHAAKAARAIDAIAARVPSVSARGTPVLVGCSYARGLPDVAEHALAAAAKLVDGPVRPVRACCGQPLRDAGDLAGFRVAQRSLEAELAGAERVIAVDPGCAATLRAAGERPVTLLVELAAQSLARLQPVASDLPLRYHDPCRLARGLGIVDEPRAVLTRITGVRPGELPRSREKTACSGGGGQLHATMPLASRAIARARRDEHDEAGGGEIVTACAASVLRFRKAGARASDLAAWIDRALR